MVRRIVPPVNGRADALGPEPRGERDRVAKPAGASAEKGDHDDADDDGTAGIRGVHEHVVLGSCVDAATLIDVASVTGHPRRASGRLLP